MAARLAGSDSMGPQLYVFAYGSLLQPESLHRTLPGVQVADCVPARSRGRVRAFTVAFPNDGSQADKSYFTRDGARPPYVLFADLRPGRANANGVCLPVSAEGLSRLVRRERRYRLVDLTGTIQSYPGHPDVAGSVHAFVGRTEFTDPERTAAGCVPSHYLAGTAAGAQYWDSRAPGFLADFLESTQLPAPSRVVPMMRVDH